MKRMLLVGLIVMLVLPSFVSSSTARLLPKDTAVDRTATAPESHTQHGLPYVDVRRDPETQVLNGATLLAGKRAPVDRSAAVGALIAEAPLRDPNSLVVDLHDTGVPKSIVNLDGFLSDARSGSPDTIARDFLAEHSELFGLSADEVQTLRVTMNTLDEASGVTYLKYEQTIAGMPVFDSEIGVTITASGEVVIVNQGHILPGAFISTEAGIAPNQAVAKAFAYCGVEISPDAVRRAFSKRDEASEFTYYANPLGEGCEDVAFQKTVVNVGGEAVLAHRTLVNKTGDEWYETLVDANTGELLVRANLVYDLQGQVFTRTPNFARTLVTFAPTPVNPSNPWLTGTVTTGNNVDAYLDRDGNDQPDSTTTGGGMASNAGLTNGRADTSKGTPGGQFSFSWSAGADPTTQQAQSVTNLFYMCNFMHDWMYSLGFTESARNFQTNNYGRGGAGGDAMMAEAQDGTPLNNSAYSVIPPDGQRPRMNMGLYQRNATVFDTGLDGDVVLHEYGHGVSSRLIGNGSSTALRGTQSGALAEGWSDYWAASKNNDGAIAEYLDGDPTGIRRAVYAVPANAIHDSYADLGNQGFIIVNDSEIWAATLWDLYKTLGKTKTDKIVFDGMRNTPTNPSFVNARNGILTACNLHYSADTCTAWAVFARHGLGYSATGNDGTTHNAAYNPPMICVTICTSGVVCCEGEEVFLPSYTCTTGGRHSATLTAPENVNYYPSLQKWNGSAWVTVAECDLSSQTVIYDGTPGQYRWRVWSLYNGGYGYQICVSRPD